MILALDVGNTNIVMGCIEDGKILNIVRLQTHLNETDVEYAIKLRQVLDFSGINSADFEGAIISSVVPPVTAALTAAVKLVSGIDCMVVGPGMKTGLNVKIDNPGTLAGDIVAGSVAAVAYYGTPVMVLDMGTATTMVVIDKNNGYLGGAILPGIKLGLSALSAGTSLLPDISITAPRKVISSNTVDSMRSGAVFGTASTIDGMIERMEEELGYPCKTIIATGGLSKAVTPLCKREIVYDGDLLLKGLWVLYEKNKK